MIATSVSFARPLVVKKASSQKQRTAVKVVSQKQEETCPALDRRSMIPLMLLPALLLVARPASALGKDPRQAAKESQARKAKMREALKAKTAANKSAPAAAPASAE